MTAPSVPPSDAEAPSPSRPSRLERILTVAVVVMGVLLIGGVLTVIGTIIYRISNREPANRLPAASSLPADGSIKMLSLDGDRLAIVLEGPAGETIVVYDLARGQEVTRVTLGASPGR